MARKPQLVCQYLENISRHALERDQAIKGKVALQKRLRTIKAKFRPAQARIMFQGIVSVIGKSLTWSGKWWLRRKNRAQEDAQTLSNKRLAERPTLVGRVHG